MARYTLNIGLANPFTGTNNTLDDTLAQALRHIATVRNIAVKQSASEPTLVIDFDTIVGSLNVLACALDQDCIALYDNIKMEGFLYGDKAEAWAPFNPDAFLII